MPSPQRRDRKERVEASYSSRDGKFSMIYQGFIAHNQGVEFLLIFLTSAVIALLIQAYDPPLQWRYNDVPERTIVCRTPFLVVSGYEKIRDQERARMEAPHVFVNDLLPLVQLRESLWNTVAAMVRFRKYDRLDDQSRADFDQFLPRPKTDEKEPPVIDKSAVFDKFVAHFKDAATLDQFSEGLRKSFTPFEVHGLLDKLTYDARQGSQDHILVYRKGDPPDSAVSFRVNEVMIKNGQFRESFKKNLPRDMQNDDFVQLLSNWLGRKVEATLQEDDNATLIVQQKAADEVQDVYVEFTVGKPIISAGTLLGKSEMTMLQAEYDAFVEGRTDKERIHRFAAATVIIASLFGICWGFVRRRERRRPHTIPAFSTMLIGMILAVAFARLVQHHSLTSAEWEILPLLLFTITVSITYSWEIAIVFSFALILILSLGTGGGINLLIILSVVTISATLQLGRLHSRRKLIVVGFNAGVVAFLITLAVYVFAGHPIDDNLLRSAFINFIWAFASGFVLTGLLPFIEGPFNILSDMSLLVLADISHPLLQNLIRVAPATYNHSMQVGIIAETAAEAIGARGLFTRVGAYFHDIGKSIKPEYYSENQAGIENIHNTLGPQLSTLVVVAHVKDGVAMAKQHRLPKPLIDLIEQHHGTSLVSFFYGKAKAANKDNQNVEESTFRYPGPKPTTKEAAILMIADSCESACRSMGPDATPGKIENKVRLIIKQKLDDGQLDNCHLTLHELKIVENCVIKSIIAAMHGRVRYPEPEPKRD